MLLWLEFRDPEVASRVRQLLAADSGTGSILDRAPHLIAMPSPNHGTAMKADARIGRRLGAWRIERIIGSGGMGTVYAARRDDGAFEREVALKCIHSELVSGQTHAAFQNERNALAALNHRDIVPILDGGLDGDGTPWFVMPLVNGVPIDRCCDERHLGIRERVALFVQVCDALAYVHARGVLHQDIKASAVLVTPEGQPKLLDFGLAAIARERDSTPAGERASAFSAGYAAPELLAGCAPSVALDIHALGVLLYRLLCGGWPIPNSPLHLPLSIIVRKATMPPSELAMRLDSAECGRRRAATPAALRRLLAGDLDCIAMKCVACDPGDRYPDVDALRDDLRRWLNRLPISLRGGAGYRIQRFVQRNAAAVCATTLLALVVLSAGGFAWQQRRQAAHELHVSGRVDQIFSQSLGAAALSSTGDLPMTSSQLLERTERHLRRYAMKDPPEVLARGLSILARSRADAGNYARAEHLALESSRIGDGNTLQFAFNRASLARIRNLRAQHVDAEQVSREGLERLGIVLGQQERLAMIQLKTQLAVARSGQGDSRTALQTLSAAIRDAARLASPSRELSLAQLLTLRGTWHRQRLMLDASEDDLIRAIALADPIEPRIVDDARESLMRTVRASRKPGREARAMTMARDLLDSRMRSLGERHPQTGVAWSELAFMQMLDQDNTGADASIAQAADILRSTVGDRHPAYARVLTARAHLRSFAGEFTEAIDLTQRALGILERRYGERHELTLDTRFLLSNQYSWRAARDPAMRDKALALQASTIGASVEQHGQVAAVHRIAYASMLANAGRLQEAERQIAVARLDATRQYGEDSQEMLHVRLAECTMLDATETDGACLARDLAQLIEDAGRVDTLYARAILWTALLQQAEWKHRSGDALAARQSLARAREIAVDVDLPSWIGRVDDALNRLRQ
ncbi:protein kinase domain-containing protein [Luteimonas sp. R10]|uniref:serine/threonine protein kinase n=1 Tax=Luteimonas sp. R10 TaxID=3108176 RepID=UPI003087DE4F|nr:serine/threonine-protein kinase [Luteimonas sp. R10]